MVSFEMSYWKILAEGGAEATQREMTHADMKVFSPLQGYRAVAVFLIGPNLLFELCSRIISCYLCTFETEIGLGLTFFGIAFTFFGIMLFFDQKLLAMGNVRNRFHLCKSHVLVFFFALFALWLILFLFGVTLTIGPMYAVQFFMKRQNLKGTMAFGSGFALLILGWPFVGMILEGYGSIVLFRFGQLLLMFAYSFANLIVLLADGFILQWLLADTGCLFAEDTLFWLDTLTTIYSIIPKSVKRQKVALVRDLLQYGYQSLDGKTK
ncbi:Vesicle transport protein, Got1/SFT2-like [Dillenia turbinata]|uniref:Vesicle transport protein, Got1/SFT2-like n=1 Tax=Dillenia turbinata TaxID=194707 RepID=A0AAN8Z2B7_9MAGN